MLMVMKTLRILTTSIAFLCTAVAISAVLWALAASGHELVPGHRVDNWLVQGTFTALYALLAGLLVDALRWISAVAWRSAEPRQTGRALPALSTEAGCRN